MGSSFFRGASQYKVGGVSLTTWGIIGLLAGGAYVATQN